MADTDLADAALFHSAAGMADAVHYADWTYSLFASEVSGDVLEVGCGVGTFTRRLAASPSVRRLLSIDVSGEAVKYCRQTIASPTLELRHASVTDVVEAGFDLVLCMNVLEHIADHASALRHMVDRLKPGGRLFLLVPAHQWLYGPFDAASGHFRRYSKRDMRALASAAVPEARIERQFYFNAIGAIGYFVVYRVLRKPATNAAGAEVGWFDRYIVPVQRRLEPAMLPFGISLVSVLTREVRASR